MSAEANVKCKLCLGYNKNKTKCIRPVKDSTIEFCWQHQSQYISAVPKKQYKAPIDHTIDKFKMELNDTRNNTKYLEEQMKSLDLGSGKENGDATEADLAKINECAMAHMCSQQKEAQIFNSTKNLIESKKDLTNLEKSFKVVGVTPKSIDSYPKLAEHGVGFTNMMTKELKKFQSKVKTFEYKKQAHK